jgi:diguanylate cyclase (GGDEF)-like protein
MSRLALLLLTSSLLHEDVAAPMETLESLRQRVAVLESVVDEQRQAARRNGIVAGILAVGLTGFAIYSRRVHATRLTETLGVTDSLTGLRNRHYVAQTINADCDVATRQHRMATAAGLAPPMNSDLLFVMIDIDRFKNINQEFGQAAGDRLLIQIADVLRSTCRTSDTVARWSGAEFLAILRFTNRHTAPISAERIRMAIEQRVLDLGNGRTTSCTCSIGFAPFPLLPTRPEESSWERALVLADEALQRAKQSGGNTWVGADTSTSATRIPALRSVR